ncbi:MAG: hypothetical protein RSG23_06230 [Gordonibacter sp.]|uniref:hypothetical protein n=1 Tax=Gordonibacter sp. TaxID=1968902 RepID=UPI002FC7F269
MIEYFCTDGQQALRKLEDLYVLDSSLVYLKTSLVTNDAIFDKHLRRFAFATDEARERLTT